MKKIIAKFAHIDGHWPFDKKVVLFSDDKISIGRLKECNFCFPSTDEYLSISRTHAIIIRKGDRFKIIDKSSHGTFVNGDKISDCYLNQGDIIVFSDNITKVGFNIDTIDHLNKDDNSDHSANSDHHNVNHSNNNMQNEPVKGSCKTVKANLHIQYGLQLKSWDSLPITIGRNANCDFILDHPSILDHHVRIFFNSNNYYIEDLTGSNLITINDKPVEKSALLIPESTIALSPQGPDFLFSDVGSLIGIERQKNEGLKKNEKIANPKEMVSTQQKKLSIFDKFRKKFIR